MFDRLSIQVMVKKDCDIRKCWIYFCRVPLLATASDWKLIFTVYKSACSMSISHPFTSRLPLQGSNGIYYLTLPFSSDAVPVYYNRKCNTF